MIETVIKLATRIGSQQVEIEKLKSLLKECDEVLFEHHSSHYSNQIPGTVCPICYPKNFQFKLREALKET